MKLRFSLSLLYFEQKTNTNHFSPLFERLNWEKSLSMPISNDDTIHVPSSAGGPTLAFMLNILRGYNFSSKAIENDDEKIHTYHRIIEAFKFGMSF